MNDEYEIFDNVDVPEESDPHKEKNNVAKKPVIQYVSLITMFLIFAVCVANLFMCIELYDKYDELQINPMMYFQNDGYINDTEAENDVLIEYSADIIETTTENKTVSNYIPSASQTTNTTNIINNTTVASTTEQTTIQATIAETTTAAEQVAEPALININTATVEELTALTGIGEVKAKAIVEYRKENGRFSCIEDITNVSGIGEKTLEKNINKITVD